MIKNILNIKKKDPEKGWEYTNSFNLTFFILFKTKMV